MDRKRVTDSVYSLRILFRGKFFLSGDKKLRYRKKIVRWLRNVDPDEVSKVVIESELGLKFGLKNIREIWFLVPGKSLEERLNKIENDTDVMDMMEYCKNDSCLQLYILLNDEVGPTQLREECVAAEGGTQCNAVVVYTGSPDREEGNGYVSESSSSGTDFPLSGDEGDDEGDLWLDPSMSIKGFLGEKPVDEGGENAPGDNKMDEGAEEADDVGGERDAAGVESNDALSQSNSTNTFVPRRSPRKTSKVSHSNKTAKLPLPVIRRSPRKKFKADDGTTFLN